VGSTSWVFACTGVYAFLLILLLAFVIIVAAALILKNQPLIPANMKGRKSRKAVAVAAEQSGKIETAIHVDEVDKPNPDIENEVPGDPFDSQVAGIEHGANEAADATKEHSAQDESTREANKDSESNATSLEIKIRRKR